MPGNHDGTGRRSTPGSGDFCVVSGSSASASASDIHHNRRGREEPERTERIGAFVQEQQAGISRRLVVLSPDWAPPSSPRHGRSPTIHGPTVTGARRRPVRHAPYPKPGLPQGGPSSRPGASLVNRGSNTTYRSRAHRTQRQQQQHHERWQYVLQTGTNPTLEAYPAGSTTMLSQGAVRLGSGHETRRPGNPFPIVPFPPPPSPPRYRQQIADEDLDLMEDDDHSEGENL